MRVLYSYVRVVAAAILSTSAIWTHQSRSSTYRDPTGHDIRFVTVDKDGRLEVLDWGRNGSDSRATHRIGAYRTHLRQLRAQAGGLLSRLWHHAAWVRCPRVHYSPTPYTGRVGIRLPNGRAVTFLPSDQSPAAGLRVYTNARFLRPTMWHAAGNNRSGGIA